MVDRAAAQGQPAACLPHHSCTGKVQDPLDGGELVVLAADDVEALIQPGEAMHELIPVHALLASGVAGVKEWQAHPLLQQLTGMVPHLRMPQPPES